MIEFIEACHVEGILSASQTGLPLSKIGSPEFIQELIRIIALKQGFGEILSRGLIVAAKAIGPWAEAMLPRFIATRGSEKKDYDPRLFITTALCYATEPRRPIQQLHEVVMSVMMCLGRSDTGSGATFTSQDLRHVAGKMWGSPIAADFSTYQGKALAAKNIQDRTYAKESLVVCDLRWTMADINRAHGGADDTVTEAQIYSAITGNEIDDVELAHTGERIFNLQRAILLRQGRQGRRSDGILDYFFSVPLQKGELFYNAEGLVPGKNGEIISRIGCVLDRNEFENIKTEYYALRGWDPVSGLPTRAKLDELDLNEVADDLAGRNLLK
jgi:aldehyde:ferredoxin oxidoreductase